MQRQENDRRAESVYLGNLGLHYAALGKLLAQLATMRNL